MNQECNKCGLLAALVKAAGNSVERVVVNCQTEAGGGGREQGVWVGFMGMTGNRNFHRSEEAPKGCPALSPRAIGRAQMESVPSRE